MSEFRLNVSYKGKRTAAETATEPVVHFPKKEGMFYTILILDPDAPAGTWLHMLKMNVTSEKEHGNVVMSYVAPSPPAGSGFGPQGTLLPNARLRGSAKLNRTHRYITSVYEQHGYVSPLPQFQTRAKFSIQTFLHTYGFQHLGSSIFTVDSKPKHDGRRRKTRKAERRQ